MRVRDLGYWTWRFLGTAILKELASTQGPLACIRPSASWGLFQVDIVLRLLLVVRFRM